MFHLTSIYVWAALTPPLSAQKGNFEKTRKVLTALRKTIFFVGAVRALRLALGRACCFWLPRGHRSSESRLRVLFLVMKNLVSSHGGGGNTRAKRIALAPPVDKLFLFATRFARAAPSLWEARLPAVWRALGRSGGGSLDGMLQESMVGRQPRPLAHNSDQCTAHGPWARELRTLPSINLRVNLSGEGDGIGNGVVAAPCSLGLVEGCRLAMAATVKNLDIGDGTPFAAAGASP